MNTVQLGERNFLNVGCGRNILPDAINLDSSALPGVDVVADLNKCKDEKLPLPDDSIDEFLLSHVIEHISTPLDLMQELHRIAKPGAVAKIRVPYGSSDDAFEDPTHVRQYFANSFRFFSQPAYWRADYNYRGDWEVKSLRLFVNRQGNEGLPVEEVLLKINAVRNIVLEMVGELEAVKPLRRPKRELLKQSEISISLE